MTATSPAIAGRAHAGRGQLGAEIAQQNLRLPDRPVLAEELRRDIGNLMGFVQNDRLRPRQEVTEALVLEREVGEQQVVIHHHDVG